MQFPLESAFLEERAAVLETMSSLPPEEFERGTTLCEEWAPRDILAHLIGLDSQLAVYLEHPLSVRKGNAAVVDRFRELSRDELLAKAETWAAHPSPLIRPGEWYLLGDLAMHHQDVLRGQGENRELSRTIKNALLFEGSVLGVRRLLSHRVVPTDGPRARGRGQTVRGTSEALALWLAGRKGLEGELEFA